MRKVSKLRARLLACVLVAAAPLVAAGQGRERVVEYDWKGAERPAPLLDEGRGEGVQMFETYLSAVELVEVSAAGQAVGVGRAFGADDDWMKGLSVRLRNVSGRKIKGATLYLSLPEARHGGGAIQLSLAYEQGGGQGGVAPGDEFDLTLAPAEHERQRARVAKLTGVKSVGRVGLGFVVIEFEDGTRWYCQAAGI